MEDGGRRAICRQPELAAVPFIQLPGSEARRPQNRIQFSPDAFWAGYAFQRILKITPIERSAVILSCSLRTGFKTRSAQGQAPVDPARPANGRMGNSFRIGYAAIGP
jgi:hypothetical protein